MNAMQRMIEAARARRAAQVAIVPSPARSVAPTATSNELTKILQSSPTKDGTVWLSDINTATKAKDKGNEDENTNTVETSANNTSTGLRELDKHTSSSSMPNSASLADRLESIRNAARLSGANNSNVDSAPIRVLNKDEITYDMLNPDQKMAVDLAKEGKSFCLIGSAGSGKTTSTRSVCTTLAENNLIGRVTEGTDKVLCKDAPSVLVLSFTNQAVRNIKEALPSEFKPHCSTFHMVLEYAPDYYEVEVLDSDGHPTGDYKNSKRFIPKYGTQPNGDGGGEFLPHIDVVIVEEAGSVPLGLFKTFLSALPRPDNTTFIYLGDLQQLPPVFDDAILGFKLLEHPIVELTEVYRNVGLVTKLAQRILAGKPMLDKECVTYSQGDDSGSITFKPFSKKVDSETATMALGTYFKKLVISGDFNPAEDVLLVPFNKALGSTELNKWIGQGLAERDDIPVHQVKSGFFDLHFCVGDKVLYNKEYWLIDRIEKNTSYIGNRPLPASIYVDRWGRIASGKQEEVLGVSNLAAFQDDIDLEALLDKTADALTGETSTHASSIITLRNIEDPKRTTAASKVGEVNSILQVAVLTVHKSLGSEWRRVWCLFHHTHSVMINRELLYTAITRARRDLTIMYSGQDKLKIGDSIFQKGIINQKLKGNTIDKKLDYYRSKVAAFKIKEEIAARTPN